MFNKIWKSFTGYCLNNKSNHVLMVIAFLFLVLNVFFIYRNFFLTKFNTIYTISFIMVDIITISLILLLTIKGVFISFPFIRLKKRDFSKLRKRIILAFSMGAALPTIIVAIFSTCFFNYGVEAWFDKKISKVLDQSIHVGESYVEEHILQIKETAISVADDLNAMYYDLIHNPELFSKTLNAQADLRSIDEAIVFQKDTNTILAQTSFSFSLSFTTIPPHIMDRVNKGEVVQITSDPTKIRVLIKLCDYNDTYLLVGRFIDTKIINHINKTNGAAKEYFAIKDQISTMQIRFSIVFILFSLILLLVAIMWGKKFAERIVQPIRELVKASERVKNGDLSVQLPIKGLQKDEIRVLSSAFNRMVSQIDRQQKDLIVAQRAHAWADVARKVAHEIKNPLTPIQLSADRLLKKFKDEVSDPESFVKYIKNILKYSNDIKVIVSEFVDFARLPAPHFSKCEIISMINDLLESRKLINDMIHYSFVSNVKQFDFVCDIAQINRVMVNLLLNAEEAFEPHMVDKKIKVEVNVKDSEVKIIVTDNASGFSDKLLNSAKEAYVTTKSGGTGLGLAIVDRIALDHFGSMRLDNNKHGGALVELTFNVEELKNRLK